jgi:plasmid stability protein
MTKKQNQDEEARSIFFHVNRRLHEELKVHAAKQNQSMSDILRELLMKYLKMQRGKEAA